jgi:GMP synthase-like glutamine amidotransferase
MGVHDTDDFPWLESERALIRDVVDAGLPVLGVCLGAQQLAAALGAEVTTGAVEEIGPGEVALTADGRRDPVLGPEYNGLAGTSVPCVHWHRDTFALPDGAVHLAATRAYPHQAFRVGSRAYGLQFHVEVDESLADAWRPLLPDDITLDGAAVARVAGVGRRVFQRFVEVAGADGAGVQA